MTTQTRIRRRLRDVPADPAVARLAAAAESASRRGDHHQAAVYYTRALEASGGAPDIVAKLDGVLDRLGDAHDPDCGCDECCAAEWDRIDHEYREVV